MSPEFKTLDNGFARIIDYYWEVNQETGSSAVDHRPSYLDENFRISHEVGKAYHVVENNRHYKLIELLQAAGRLLGKWHHLSIENHYDQYLQKSYSQL